MESAREADNPYTTPGRTPCSVGFDALIKTRSIIHKQDETFGALFEYLQSMEAELTESKRQAAYATQFEEELPIMNGEDLASRLLPAPNARTLTTLLDDLATAGGCSARQNGGITIRIQAVGDRRDDDDDDDNTWVDAVMGPSRR